MWKMDGECRILLLTYTVTFALPVSLGFNIDTTDPVVYAGERKDFFGYKVLQFTSGTDKGIFVSAPLHLNGSGGICKPDLFQSTHCFSPRGVSSRDSTITVRHFGMSIAKDSTRSQYTVCSPSLVQDCDENSYLNGACFELTDQLEQVSSFTPSFQECTNKTVELAFLFDGSGSMTVEEFDKNKAFIEDIMDNLKSTSIKFAAVQFASDHRKVFDFDDFQANRALAVLRKEAHMKGLTNTYSALEFVMSDIFENPGAGASPDATKVLVLITDGDPSDLDKKGIIKSYDDKNIIRFVIGVKDAKLDKFRAIASDPKEKNAFKIQNYDELPGVLENFQKKIFGIEGAKEALAEDLTNEMSQSGFSAAFHKDTLILGSVGANSWRGSLLELHEQKQTHIEDPLMPMDSYMGYSVSVGERNKVSVYFAGAPRFEHTGQVVLFRHDGKNWTVAQRIHGDQIGSYFGAELCSLDVDSDGNTDFLLVGAPLFYQPQEKSEGQMCVYSLTDEMQLRSELNVTVSSMGRFGTSISSLTDVNGDGLRDVAVGAPLEDDNRGAVYMFLGDRQRGIRSTSSQRIMGQKIDSRLRFFGQAIDGGIDLGEDGLPDIVIGSQGMAVVLRSRPVFNVSARLSFRPATISTDEIDCLGNTGGHLPMVNLTVCFDVVETTESKAGALTSGLNVSYAFDVDPMSETHRGFFSQDDRRARNLTSTCELRDKDTCFHHSVYMPVCVKDVVSPILIKFNFSQDDSESAAAVLNVDSKRQAVVEAPFKKQCVRNDTCVAELEVDFNFTTLTLLVAEDNYFNLSVKLSNHGDESYNTTLSVHYPPGLSFSRMTLTKATRPTRHSCDVLEGVLDRIVCGISLPVYRSRSAVTFKTSFHISTEHEWNDTVSITVTGESDNTNSTRTGSLTKSIPVQYEINMAVTVGEDTVTYLNFTTEDAAPKKMVAIYKINNPGLRAFPVNVSLFFPTKLEHDFEMKNYRVLVQQNRTRCTDVTDMKSEYCSPEKHCKVIVCDGFILDKESTTEFVLSGDVQFRDLKQNSGNVAFLKRYTGDGGEVRFKSFVRVRFDKRRYVLDSPKEEKMEKSAEFSSRRDNDPTFKSAEVRVVFIILPDQLLILLTGAGIGFFLLILITVLMFKLGCFRRKTLEYYQEREEETAVQTGTPTSLTSGPADGIAGPPDAPSKSDQRSEEKALCGDGEAGGNTDQADSEGPD